MNDYAQKRYYDIQTSIFVNGGDTYLEILRNIKEKWQDMKEVVTKKYTTDEATKHSDWNLYWIFGLFVAIAFYALVAIGLNLLVFKFMPKRFHTVEFLKKRSSIMWATTTITLAILMGLIQYNSHQNFVIMASGLLVEYLWLLAVILISLLLRVNASQIKKAFKGTGKGICVDGCNAVRKSCGLKVFYGFDMAVYVEFYSSNVNIIRKFCKAY